MFAKCQSVCLLIFYVLSGQITYQVHGREMSAAYGHVISQSAGGVNAFSKVNANLLISHPSLTVSRKFYLPYSFY